MTSMSPSQYPGMAKRVTLLMDIAVSNLTEKAQTEADQFRVHANLGSLALRARVPRSYRRE